MTVAVLMLVGSPSLATSQDRITNRFFTAYAYEAITVDATVGGVAFTTAKLTDTVTFQSAQLAVIAVECASSSPCDIRYTYDGTTVTSTDGIKLSEGSVATFYGNENLRRARFIRTGSNSATLRVIYHY